MTGADRSEFSIAEMRAEEAAYRPRRSSSSILAG